MTPNHRPMTVEDVDEVLSLPLCPEDVAELQALTGQDSETVLIQSLECTDEPWVVTLDGRIVAVYGVAASRNTQAEAAYGLPWFLSTGEVALFSRKFLRESKAVISRFHKKHQLLSNLVDMRHTKAVRWLKWLGFEFLDEELFFHDPYVPFKQFVRYAADV